MPPPFRRLRQKERYPKVRAVQLTTATRVGGSPRWEIDVPRDIAGLSAASVVECNEVHPSSRPT